MPGFEPDFEEINRAVTELNKIHFCVFVGSSYMIAYKKPVSGSDDYNLIFIKDSALLLMYKNHKIKVDETKQGKPQFKTWAELWLDSPDRLNYNDVVFKPTSKVYPDEFNIWNGFNVDEKKLSAAKIGMCNNFLDFILEVVCSGSENLFNYILDWCADAVQNPEDKQGVALILKSKMNGTGKTFFCNCFGRLFGKHYMLASKQDSILGRFSGHLEYNIVLGAEEAVFANNKKGKNELKDMITSDTRNIERKGIDVELNKPNYTHIIFMSNEDHVMSIDMSDRRFQVIEVSTKKAKNKKYFTGLRKKWETGERESFLKLLQERDIKNLNLEDSRIINRETLEQRALSRPDFEKWLLKILIDGGLNGYKTDQYDSKVDCFYTFYDNEHTDIDSDQYYFDYIDFCKNMKTKTIRTKQELSRMIRKIVDIKSERRYVENFKKVTPWRFPALIEARNQWKKFDGNTNDWTDEDRRRQMKNSSSVQLEVNSNTG